MSLQQILLVIPWFHRMYVQNDLPVIHVSKYGKQWPVLYVARSVPSGMVTIETEIVSLNLIPVIGRRVDFVAKLAGSSQRSIRLIEV